MIVSYPDAGEALVEALKFVGESLVVNAEQSQNRRVEVKLLVNKGLMQQAPAMHTSGL